MAVSKEQWRRRKFFDLRYIRYESRRHYVVAGIFFLSILFYFICEHYVISIGIVRDRSMQPLVSDGNTFLVNKYIYFCVPPSRGDIVILARNLYIDGQYVKRIVGMPGEIISMRNGRVYINGKLLPEPYAVGDTFPDMAPMRIGEDQYFVLGDNRMISEDSRYFGCVPRRNIEGKIRPGVLFTLW